MAKSSYRPQRKPRPLASPAQRSSTTPTPPPLTNPTPPPSAAGPMLPALPPASPHFHRRRITTRSPRPFAATRKPSRSCTNASTTSAIACGRSATRRSKPPNTNATRYYATAGLPTTSPCSPTPS